MNLFERIQIVSAVCAVYALIVYHLHEHVRPFMGPVGSKAFAALYGIIGTAGAAFVSFIVFIVLHWVLTGDAL